MREIHLICAFLTRIFLPFLSLILPGKKYIMHANTGLWPRRRIVRSLYASMRGMGNHNLSVRARILIFICPRYFARYGIYFAGILLTTSLRTYGHGISEMGERQLKLNRSRFWSLIKESIEPLIPFPFPEISVPLTCHE